MSTVLVLVVVVVAGCSDTASGPDPGDAPRADDPSGEDPADRDPASEQDGGDGADEDGIDAETDDGVGEPDVAGNPPLGPTEFRARWNEVVGATDGGGEARFLAMGELQPGDDGDDLAAVLRGDAGREEGLARVSATLDADGALAAISIRLLDAQDATQTSRELTEAALVRALLASTLPSQPALRDPAVTEPAEALSLDGSHGMETVVAEGNTYSIRSDDDGWAVIAQFDS